MFRSLSVVEESYRPTLIPTHGTSGVDSTIRPWTARDNVPVRAVVSWSSPVDADEGWHFSCNTFDEPADAPLLERAGVISEVSHESTTSHCQCCDHRRGVGGFSSRLRIGHADANSIRREPE